MLGEKNKTDHIWDKLSRHERSLLMSKVRDRDTRPEVLVCKSLFKQGFRYRKNVKTLPGKPDIVLPKYQAAVLVHGCFWHQHVGCKEAVRPKTRQEYWDAKLNKNVERDIINKIKLQELGWRVFVVWECELRPCVRSQTIEKLIENLKSLSPRSGEC